MKGKISQELLACFGCADRTAVAHAAGTNAEKQLLWLESRIRQYLIPNRPGYYFSNGITAKAKKNAAKLLSHVNDNLKKYLGVIEEKIEKREKAVGNRGRKVVEVDTETFAEFLQWSDMNKLSRIKKLKKSPAYASLSSSAQEILKCSAVFQAYLKQEVKEIASFMRGEHVKPFYKVQKVLDKVLARRVRSPHGKNWQKSFKLMQEALKTLYSSSS
jgi:hypothetical protein